MPPDHPLLRESGTPAGLTGKSTGLRRFEGFPPWVSSAGLSVFLLWFSQQTGEPVSTETGSFVVVILEHIRQDIRNISHILLMPQRI